ncbi:transglutaminase-like putative cysteine protease [Rhizomicrobium palustre]|uniref:Transglutaminase-like putative cysteine protease n=1 Tax=Rhizomicrobium palustre TaxID=189966 RepID=A0A846MXS1_9PROT|nr:transglutaminase family protein [Rhizomicrobium palustre]NIK88394.1 transglutaminase-like putative cysteine protease [Rhizomicrobium palustre]
MEYFVRHRTAYRYLQDVSSSCHLAHLLPRSTPRQSVTESKLIFSPEPQRNEAGTDYFGNQKNLFTIEESHTVLEVISESRVTVQPAPSFAPGHDLAWEKVRSLLEEAGDAQSRAAAEFLFDTPQVVASAELAAYAEESFTPGRGILSAAADLTTRVHRDFRYDTTVTDVYTPVEKVFRIRAGVCQDLAHVAIAAIRAIGLSARYVSGYLLTSPPPGQPRLVGADASHAWFSIWVPECGWIDFDPTNNMQAGESHITAAWGRDYADVAPIAGVITGGGDHIVEVGVDVVPVSELEA